MPTSDPAHPVELGKWRRDLDSYTNDVVMHGEESYGAHLSVLDADPQSATFLQPPGSYKTRDNVSSHNIMAVASARTSPTTKTACVSSTSRTPHSLVWSATKSFEPPQRRDRAPHRCQR